MSTFSELIDAGKEHRVTFRGKEGKRLLELSVLWAVLIAVAAPQALLVVILLAWLELISVELDGKPVGVAQKE